MTQTPITISTPTPPSSLRVRHRREPTPDKEFVAIKLDSIASPGPTPDSPRGKYVSTEPAVEVSEEELRDLGLDTEPVVTEPIPIKSPPHPIPVPVPVDSKEEPVEDDDDEKDLTDDQKRLLIQARIQILKRGWPDIHVPEEGDKDKISLKVLTKYYNKLKGRVFAEECSGGYRKWLIAMFVFLEVLCVKVFKIDLSGFTMNQVLALNSYQTLLLELAEKYGSNYKSYFPVELRLMFMVLVNGVVFFVLRLVFGDANSESSRAIASALGGGNSENGGMASIIGNVMNMVTGGPPKGAGTGETLKEPAPRRKRRDQGTE